MFKNYAINESFYKCTAIGLHTLNRTQLLELLKEMKWEL